MEYKKVERKMRIYSERKVKSVFLAISIPLILIVTLGMIWKECELWQFWVIWLLMLAVTLFIKNKGIGWFLDHYLWLFENDGIVQQKWWRSRKYSYADVIQGMQKKPMKITPFAYVVPMKKGCIRFYYDMDVTRQRHLLTAYRYLIKQIKDEITGLPDMSKVLIEEMDQRAYCHKKRRNYTIAAFCMSMLIPLILETVSVIMGIFVLAVQYVSLWKIFTGIYFGRKSEERIKERFKRYTQVKLQQRRVSYVYLVVIVILMAGLNGFWIWF